MVQHLVLMDASGAHRTHWGTAPSTGHRVLHPYGGTDTEGDGEYEVVEPLG